MRTILFFYIITLLFGCRLYPKDYQVVDGGILQSSGSNCSALFAEIKEKWAVHKTVHKEDFYNRCFYYNKKLTEKIIENKDCLIGLRVYDISKLMGEPSGISGHNYFYLMSQNCADVYDYINDEYSYLRFTALDTITDVDHILIVTDY